MICKITIFFQPKKKIRKIRKILRMKKIRKIRILDLWFKSFKVTNFGTNGQPVCAFLCLAYLPSCTVSEIWRIIGPIFALDREMPPFNALDGLNLYILGVEI